MSDLNENVLTGGDFASGLSNYGSAMKGSVSSMDGKNAQFIAIINSFSQQEWRNFKVDMAGANRANYAKYNVSGGNKSKKKSRKGNKRTRKNRRR
jgi:hypothetical protein